MAETTKKKEMMGEGLSVSYRDESGELKSLDPSNWSGVEYEKQVKAGIRCKAGFARNKQGNCVEIKHKFGKQDKADMAQGPHRKMKELRKLEKEKKSKSSKKSNKVTASSRGYPM